MKQGYKIVGGYVKKNFFWYPLKKFQMVFKAHKKFLVGLANLETLPH